MCVCVLGLIQHNLDFQLSLFSCMWSWVGQIAHLKLSLIGWKCGIDQCHYVNFTIMSSQIKNGRIIDGWNFALPYTVTRFCVDRIPFVKLKCLALENNVNKICTFSPELSIVSLGNE